MAVFFVTPTVPLARCDERRQRLPRTIQIEAGVFLWCDAGRIG